MPRRRRPRRRSRRADAPPARRPPTTHRPRRPRQPRQPPRSQPRKPPRRRSPSGDAPPARRPPTTHRPRRPRQPRPPPRRRLRSPPRRSPSAAGPYARRPPRKRPRRRPLPRSRRYRLGREDGVLAARRTSCCPDSYLSALRINRAPEDQPRHRSMFPSRYGAAWGGVTPRAAPITVHGSPATRVRVPHRTKPIDVNDPSR